MDNILFAVIILGFLALMADQFFLNILGVIFGVGLFCVSMIAIAVEYSSAPSNVLYYEEIKTVHEKCKFNESLNCTGIDIKVAYVNSYIKKKRLWNHHFDLFIPDNVTELELIEY